MSREEILQIGHRRQAIPNRVYPSGDGYYYIGLPDKTMLQIPPTTAASFPAEAASSSSSSQIVNTGTVNTQVPMTGDGSLTTPVSISKRFIEIMS